MSDVQSALRDYMEGANLGDRDRLGAVLHPDFRTAGYWDGKLIWMTRDDALAAAGGDTVPEWHMTSPIIHGDTAQTIVSSMWNGKTFVEIVTLIRVEDKWQLVFKSFHAG